MSDHATQESNLPQLQLRSGSASHEEEGACEYTSTETTSHSGDIRRGTLRQRRRTAAFEEPVIQASLVCGLMAGMAQAGVFNPYDRALYLSVKENRPFLSLQNWKSPYAGFLQSISGRALSGGLYFPLEHFFLQCLDRRNDNLKTRTSAEDSRSHFYAGTAAGAVNACVINPLSAIKYKTWGRDVQRGMWREISGMLTKSGFSLRPFLNGLVPTVYRDVVFGGVYTWSRLKIQNWLSNASKDKNQSELYGQPLQSFGANMIAAAFATVASGPFNYARNVQYATSSRERAEGTWTVLRDLGWQTYYEHRTAWERWTFLQNRLRLGWGTARVALGMAFGHAVYDWLHNMIRRY